MDAVQLCVSSTVLLTERKFKNSGICRCTEINFICILQESNRSSSYQLLPGRDILESLVKFRKLKLIPEIMKIVIDDIRFFLPTYV